MSTRIGHASISENDTINGAKGDSTGREVCVQEWFSMNWDYMAIHPEADVREKHAQAIEAACENDNIGYGQSDRNTLNALARAVGYNLSRVGKCNCDCSSLQNVAAVASGASGVTYGGNGWTTSTMKSALTSAGYKIVTDSTYLNSANYCVRGAIYVKAGTHTICGLDNGANYEKTLARAGISTSQQSNSTQDETTYTVQRGDTLSAIAVKYGVKWQDLASYNHIANASFISVGQEIKIPGGASTGGASTYTVQRGDSLWSIAAKQMGNGSRYKEIKELNGLKTDIIHAGLVLTLPAK